VFGSHGGCLQEGSSGFLVQSGLHDGSFGVVVQSTGGLVQDASLGFALQSIDGGVVHDGSLGLVLQSTGPGGVILHDGSFGVVLQYIGPGGGGGGGPGTLEHSGEVEPCSHVGGGGGVDGITVGVGSPIGGRGDGGVLGSSIVGLLSLPVTPPLSLLLPLLPPPSLLPPLLSPPLLPPPESLLPPPEDPSDFVA
jgi:hypothetical protein